MADVTNPGTTVTVKGRGIGEVIESHRADQQEEWSVRIRWANGKVSSFPESKVEQVIEASRDIEPTVRTTRTGRYVIERKWLIVTAEKPRCKVEE